MPVTTGLVLREPDGATVADAANGYITYVDPTTLQFGGSFRICLFQFSYLGTLFRIQFFRIERFQNRFCCVVLREKIVAETTLYLLPY